MSMQAIQIIASCATFILAGLYLMLTVVFPKSPLGSPQSRRDHKSAMLTAWGFVIVGNIGIWTLPLAMSFLTLVVKA